MKIQGIENRAVEMEIAPPRPISPKTADPPNSISPKAVDPPKEKTAADPTKGKKETESHAAPSAPPPPDQSKVIDRLAEAIRTYLRENRTSVDISVDAELQHIITRVIAQDTGKVITQYPEDAALAVMKHLKELRGLLIDGRG